MNLIVFTPFLRSMNFLGRRKVRHSKVIDSKASLGSNSLAVNFFFLLERGKVLLQHLQPESCSFADSSSRRWSKTRSLWVQKSCLSRRSSQLASIWSLHSRSNFLYDNVWCSFFPPSSCFHHHQRAESLSLQGVRAPAGRLTSSPKEGKTRANGPKLLI